MNPGFIYFLACGDYVKIGFSKKPTVRIKHVATSNPAETVLLSVHPGTQQQEKHLHNQFQAHRHRREWFRRHPEIDAVVVSGPPPLCADQSKSFSAIVDEFGVAEVASLLGVDESHVRTMKARNSIPAQYWGVLIEAATPRGMHLTYKMLRDMRTVRFSEPSRVAS